MISVNSPYNKDNWILTKQGMAIYGLFYAWIYKYDNHSKEKYKCHFDIPTGHQSAKYNQRHMHASLLATLLWWNIITIKTGGLIQCTRLFIVLRVVWKSCSVSAIKCDLIGIVKLRCDLHIWLSKQIIRLRMHVLTRSVKQLRVNHLGIR